MNLDNIVIRNATNSDIDKISEIKVNGWKNAYAGIIDNNTLSNMTNIVLSFKDKLEKETAVEVILEDERLTSKISNDILIKGDISRKKRKGVVDGVASVVILQSYLDRKDK